MGEGSIERPLNIALRLIADKGFRFADIRPVNPPDRNFYFKDRIPCPLPKRKGNRGRLPTERKLGKVNPLLLKSVKLPRRFLHLHGSKSMSGIHNVDNFGHESHA